MPDIHLAISHGFYETVRVGSPTCFRNVSVQCMSQDDRHKLVEPPSPVKPR
jgi:hypothetical protein